MGVYVFQSTHDASWIKVGHHRATPRRPNAYYRIAGRGFYSIKHPEALDGHLGVGELVLVAWYPSLERCHETRIHRACDQTRRVGEFHRVDELDRILGMCERELGGTRTPVSDAARRKALAWGARRAARAARCRRPLLATVRP
tara:strand:- start:288 stop:716 length:429 start_codon:yes stop_codon:yes gene_type:complete